jgi:hypothetical protein
LTTPDDLARWFKQLRHCARTPRPTTKGKAAAPALDFRALEQRAAQLLDRHRRVLAAGRGHDGFPAGTMGGGGGGSELTSVESASDARVFGRGLEPDRFERDCERVFDLLQQAASSLGGAVNLLDRLDGQAVADDPDPEPRCELCGQAGLDRDPARYARALEGLPHPMWVCQPHYDFVAKHQATPTPDQTRHHDESGSWRIRIDPTAAAV